MEIKVTVELGPKTFALLNGFNAQPVSAEKENTTAEKVEAEEAAPTEKPKQTRTRTSKAKEEETAVSNEVKADESAKKSETFEDKDDDEKLEAIKAEVTKHTKKGKSGDIKALLLGFDANRASELAPEDYDKFYTAVKRYGDGESVDDIIGLD